MDGGDGMVSSYLQSARWPTTREFKVQKMEKRKMHSWISGEWVWEREFTHTKRRLDWEETIFFGQRKKRRWRMWGGGGHFSTRLVTMVERKRSHQHRSITTQAILVSFVFLFFVVLERALWEKRRTRAVQAREREGERERTRLEPKIISRWLPLPDRQNRAIWREGGRAHKIKQMELTLLCTKSDGSK